MAALNKELREYLYSISPYEGHFNYLKDRFDALSFSQALREAHLIDALVQRSMIVPSKASTIHAWDEDDRGIDECTDEALEPGMRCVDIPDWFTLSIDGLDYARTRRTRNVRWIITAVLAPFVLWMITVMLPVIINVVAAWLSFT